MLVQWTPKMCPFHISKNIFWWQIHFNIQKEGGWYPTATLLIIGMEHYTFRTNIGWRVHVKQESKYTILPQQIVIDFHILLLKTYFYSEFYEEPDDLLPISVCHMSFYNKFKVSNGSHILKHRDSFGKEKKSFIFW